MREFERRLRKKIRSEVPNLESIAPSLEIEVYHRGDFQGHVVFGKKYDYYDLASLTKILFSATAWMRWISKSDFDVGLPAYWFLPWWRHKNVTLRRLLTHHAGLTWKRPYHLSLHGPMQFDRRWPQLRDLIRHGRLSVGRQAVYSDLDLFMLGYILEELQQASLPEIWNSIRSDFNLENTGFNAGNQPLHARKLYAPTEWCPWRKKLIQGEVHDEKAWALGGVAPHAGLFSSIHDISRWALMLRKALRGRATPFGDPDVVKMFTERQLPRKVGNWGYLFMKPGPLGASCGRRFSRQSFGHTGFTGTSMWMDPVRDVIVVILSNRIHPTRRNSRFLRLRPLLHDWICELL